MTAGPPRVPEPGVEDPIPLVEEVLGRWNAELGRDALGYRNHVYRLAHFCFALRPCGAEEREKVLLAGCFHDLGIWVRETFDYIEPSRALARDHLERAGRPGWIPEIDRMIEMHHKIRRVRDARHPLVEVFREADLVDVSLGVLRFGLRRAYVERVRARFPDAGFHRRLVSLAAGWISRHPLAPLPMLRW